MSNIGANHTGEADDQRLETLAVSRRDYEDMRRAVAYAKLINEPGHLGPVNQAPTAPPDDWSLAFAQALDTIRNIHYDKRNDYTGGKDPLENYRRSAEVIGVTPEQIMLARIQEKVTRLGNLLRGVEQKVKDESIEDALLDTANIALLIYTLRRFEKA